MFPRFAIMLLLAGPCWVKAQLPELNVAEFAESAKAWAVEHLDPELIAAYEEFIAIDPLTNQSSNTVTEATVTISVNSGTFAETAKHWSAWFDETDPFVGWIRAQFDAWSPQTESPSLTLATASEPTDDAAIAPWPAAASNYVAQLKPVFAAEGVPEELVWLAEVESSFNRKAVSPVGAAGLFQLMPATAERFGLSRWPFDQRFQPKPSAIAAARYLKFLRSRFDDWKLALAAYNAGEGRVRKLLVKYDARTFEAIAPYLPTETREFVPKVEATLRKREGVTLGSLPPVTAKTDAGELASREPAGS